jgi:hypothetical protein
MNKTTQTDVDSPYASARVKPQANFFSNTPYYIQNLERKLDGLEWKVDLLLKELEKVTKKS